MMPSDLALSAPGIRHPARPSSAASPATPASRLPRLLVASLYVLVIGSLFAGIPGPAALGEMRGEGAILGVAAIMAFAGLSGVIADVRGLRAILLFLPLVIAVMLSYAVNAGDIAQAHFLGRAGNEKFISALMVLAFYGAAFYAAFCIMSVYGVRLVLYHAGNAAVFASAALVVELLVELATWVAPSLRPGYQSVRQLWTVSTHAPDYRLVGFAAEPSFAAISALGMLGLLGCRAVLTGFPDLRRIRHWRTPVALMAALIALQLLADARTFLVGAVGGGLAILLIGPARKAPALLKSASIVFTPLAAQTLIVWSVLASEPGARSTSNITRSVGMVTASALWSHHPFLGVGLGQYAFNFRSVVPSWGLQSWEISRYFRTDQYDLVQNMPPSFSLFTRIGAELGVIGFLAWSTPAIYAIRRALLLAPGWVTWTLTCALAAQIWTGLSLDSFRNIFYWLWLAALLAWPSQHRAPFARPPSAQKGLTAAHAP